MKKTMKKLLPLLLAVVMCLAFAGAALAEGEEQGSITITSPQTDPNADTTTYEAYKILDMKTNGTINNDGKYTAVSYTINSSWSAFFADGAPGAAYLLDANNDEGTLNSITVNDETKYINITDSNVAVFAKAAFEYAQKNNIAPQTTEQVDKGATEVKFEGLELGYYMIYPKGASVQIEPSIVSLTNTAPNGTIMQKAKYPTMVKTADDISTEVGQKVTYTLTSNVPDTTGYSAYELTFNDKTSEGLTFDGADSIVVKIGETVLNKNTDYTVSTDSADFAVTINLLNESKAAKYAYNAAVVITYTATVNDAAVSKIDNNHATLTYNNNPKDSSSKDTTPPVEVKTYSSKVIINKVDGADENTKLAGAKFVLRVKNLGSAEGDSHESDIAAGSYYNYDNVSKDVKWVKIEGTPTLAQLAANPSITIVETNANGAAEFDGLEDGTYELVEVEAPEGYNLLTKPVEFTIAGSDEDVSTLTVTSKVQNNTGGQLPSTGGIGTTIFYIAGSALVLVAGAALFARRVARKQS